MHGYPSWFMYLLAYPLEIAITIAGVALVSVWFIVKQDEK